MRSVQLEKIFLLSYENVFEETIDSASAIKALPQQAALEFISYLLHLYNVRKRQDTGFHSRHLLQWMMQLDSPAQKKLLPFLEQEKEKIFSTAFQLLSRRPCLDLIQHILVYSEDNDQPLNHEHYTILFKCLLCFNSQENKAQERLFHWTDGNGQFLEQIMQVQVRNIEHERFKDYILQFLKIYYFFEFCETHEKYVGYLKDFLTSLQLRSYRIYLWKLISPFLRLMVSEVPTPKMHIDEGGGVMDFYERLTINGKINAVDKDYRPLRQYPLFKSEKNNYVFLDFRFFVDKFYQGFLFDFATITKIPFPQLKIDMGNEFSEHILFYTVMKKCFAIYGSIRLTGNEIKNKIGSGEPDYYIRNGTDIFLFEFKDIVIPADVKYSGDASIIQNCLIQKLEKTNDGKRKGISQLLKVMESIRSGLYAEKEVDLAMPNNAVLYPILVHTDLTLESCGVNYFLNKRMRSLAEESSSSATYFKDLVVVHIDTLLLMQDHFRSGKLDWTDCIKSYHSYVAPDDPQTAMFPFDEYLKYYFAERTNKKIGHPADFDGIISAFASLPPET
jgi:hypothetical protein